MTDDRNTPACLVIGPHWVGDMVMAQALLQTLKAQQPGRAVDVAAPAWTLPLLARMAEVRRAIGVPFRHKELALGRRIAFGRALRGQYGEAYILPGSWKSAVIPAAAAIPRRTGYLRELRYGLLTDARPMPVAFKRKTAVSYQALADPEVLADPSRLRVPRLISNAAARAPLLNRHGLEEHGFAALMPGAEFGPAKRWPVRHWRGLAGLLARQGMRTVLIGGPGDVAVGAEIAAGLESVLDLTGKTTLDEAVDVIAASRFAVSNDSGLMHVAAATGVPVVSVYGSTSPEDTPPLSASAVTLTMGLSCAPCHQRACPLTHHNCMEQIEPERVLSGLDALVRTPFGEATPRADTNEHKC